MISAPCSVFLFKQKTAYEIGVRLVGSEMCIRDRRRPGAGRRPRRRRARCRVPAARGTDRGRWAPALPSSCLLYTSDAADDLLCVDLGGRRIINKKTTT